MEIISDVNKSEVLAIGRLYEFCSNKRFHLIKNEFINDEIGKKALEVNGKIKALEGLDLFEAKNDSDLLSYEKVLNFYVSKKVKEIRNVEEIGEELDLLKASSTFPIEKMQAFNFYFGDMIKKYLKEFNINIPEIKSLCKKPDFVAYIDDSLSYFITIKTKIKYKERIVLIHLTQANPEQATTNLFKYPDRERIFRSSYFSKENDQNQNLEIRMFFVLGFDKFSHLLSNPTRLFLKCLDFYGARVEINHVIRKLHRNILLPSHIELTPNIYQIVGEKEQTRTVSLFYRTNLSLKIILLYSIYINRHIVDFKRGSI